VYGPPTVVTLDLVAHMNFFKAAIPLALRLITYNIRFANNWPVEGEGKFERSPTCRL
jgi:hypothetical protein